MISTEYGSYELVSMCINLGSNIDAQDKMKQTALKIATSKGFPGIILMCTCYKYNFISFCLLFQQKISKS